MQVYLERVSELDNITKSRDEVRKAYDDLRKHRRLYMKLRLDRDKAIFWNKTITETIEAGHIGPKEASKLAGKLCFTACAILGHTGLCRLHHMFNFMNNIIITHPLAFTKVIFLVTNIG